MSMHKQKASGKKELPMRSEVWKNNLPMAINEKAEKAMQALKEGNARFVAGTPSKKDFVAQRKAVLEGQHPYAIVLYCSDSRVPAEHIFDAGLGEIFGIRVAGNIAPNKEALGSMEYAAEHLKAPLLVVLAHTKCGAVYATCKGGQVGGNLAAVVDAIKPAASAAGNEPERAVVENLMRTLATIREKSQLLSELERKGELKIVPAIYSLETGKVEFL